MKEFLAELKGASAGDFVVLILVGPLYAALWTLAYIWYLVETARSQLRGDPTPEFGIPGDSESATSAETAATYVKHLKTLIPSAEIQETHNADESGEYKISAPIKRSLDTTIWYDEYSMGIEVEKVDSGYWNTGEQEDLSDKFYVAVAALQGKWLTHTSKLGRKEIWLYVDDPKFWFFTRAAGEHSYHYQGVRKQGPNGENELSALPNIKAPSK